MFIKSIFISFLSPDSDSSADNERNLKYNGDETDAGRE